MSIFEKIENHINRELESKEFRFEVIDLEDNKKYEGKIFAFDRTIALEKIQEEYIQ